jgi:hypothetical protein
MDFSLASLGEGRPLMFEAKAIMPVLRVTDEVLALLNETATALTARLGHGHWSGPMTRRGLDFSIRHARVRVGRDRSRGLTVWRLAPAAGRTRATGGRARSTPR